MTGRIKYTAQKYCCFKLSPFTILSIAILACIPGTSSAATPVAKLPYTLVDTGQVRCYDNTTEIEFPKTAAAFFGQDAHYKGNQPAYKDNGNGTVTDLNTGLTWTQNPGEKMTYSNAVANASKCRTGSCSDWRLPTIKELYSLILFSGTDPDPMSTNSSAQKPFIDSKAFNFRYGDTQNNERIIDSQFASSTIYRSTTMGGNKTMFGINFADGRIKGYPIGTAGNRPEKTYYVLYVRGNPGYGKKDFKDNSDGTVTDNATGLTWMKVDSGKKMNWAQALKYAEDLEYANRTDWRLPNAKELHSIVDYSRCPDVKNSPAIDPVFKVTPITNQGGQKDYPYYWTGTTHAKVSQAASAVYIAFGRALGLMQDRRTGKKQLMDVHGAGAQRADSKTGDPSKLPQSRGPQGDIIRTYNYVRCVRGGVAEPQTTGPKVEMKPTSNRQAGKRQDSFTDEDTPPPRGSFIQRLDKNNDGKVSKQEFDGPPQHFNTLDRNKDGYLSENEAPQGPPQRRNNPRQ